MTRTWIEICKKQDLPPGQVKTCSFNSHKVALCRLENGEFYAVQDLCTHDNGPLGDGEIVGNAIECPRHGARFDVKTGKVLCLPAVTPIHTYPVRVDGEVVKVEIPE